MIMELKYCKNCKHVVELAEEKRIEWGQTIKVIKCPRCNYEYSTTTSHTHYGNDGK